MQVHQERGEGLMNIKEIRDMKSEELVREIESAKKELFDLRFQMATGTIENPMRIRELKKSIARMKTVLKERAMKGE